MQKLFKMQFYSNESFHSVIIPLNLFYPLFLLCSTRGAFLALLWLIVSSCLVGQNIS